MPLETEVEILLKNAYPITGSHDAVPALLPLDLSFGVDFLWLFHSVHHANFDADRSLPLAWLLVLL